jgi:RNA polymerase sigma-70 factor (ECF subfamily)
MKPARREQEEARLLVTRQSLVGRLADWEDRRNWQEFFDTYWRLIYGVARKAGLNDAEAQDVVQETIFTVAKNIAQYDRSGGSFKVGCCTPRAGGSRTSFANARRSTAPTTVRRPAATQRL